MITLQFMDFEASQIIRAAFPNGAALTAFLGMVDGLATAIALLLQWFIVPWSLRHFGVKGTSLLYPYALLVTFGGLASASFLPPIMLLSAVFARFTRSSLLPTLRGTSSTLMLNAAPRKAGAGSLIWPRLCPGRCGALFLMFLKPGRTWLCPSRGSLSPWSLLLYP
jgi:hypothetical protein